MKILCLFLVVAPALVKGAHLRRLPSREQQESKHAAPRMWKRRPVNLFGADAATHVEGGPHRRRLQLNGGHAFIVSSQAGEGVEWCVDAVEGTAVPEDGQYPSVGFRPCAYMAGPSEQLFLPAWGGALRSKFPGDFCLVIEDSDGNPEDGDRVRLGPCADESDFAFNENAMINGLGMITAAADENLCLTFEGENPEDYDNMLMTTCQPDEDKFYFSFRTGWYELGGSGCVQVRNGDMETRNRVVYDTCQGFNGHWRIDGDGLLHSRSDDDFCMRAEGVEEGAAVRIARCDRFDDNQRWYWPDGFEAPISLSIRPDLFLSVQGQTADYGDPMVLESDGEEWSGDSVHI